MNLDFDPKKDYYKILWVSEDADADAVKKAYRKLAMKYHPDRNKGDKTAEEKFKEINEANEVLSDPVKKQQYDAYRRGDFGAAGMGGFWWFGGAWFGWGGFSAWWVDLGDLLWGMFWWWRRRAGPERGDDLLLQMNISFEQSYHGLEKQISYTRAVKAAWVEAKTCETCHGQGVVAQQVRTPFGMMQSQSACPACEGVGQEFYKNGTKISGGGLESKKEKITVKVPAGIKSWSKIRYPGKWNESHNGGETGDLYIKIVVKPSDKRKREWDNIVVNVEIPVVDAVLWWHVEVPHPDGKIKIKIPKGLQVGETIRVPNKGFSTKWLLKSKGDMIVIPKIKIPKRLSKEEEKHWKALK